MIETDLTVGEEEYEVESCVSSEVGHLTEITIETVEGCIYVFLFNEDDDFRTVYEDDDETCDRDIDRMGYERDHIPEALSGLNAIEELLINGLSGWYKNEIND